jgi:septum formation protein
MTTLVLASASPARLETLRRAGIEPRVTVSTVDEDAVLASAREAALASGGALSPADAVLMLARAKAESVAASVPPGPGGERILVLGCDSMLELDGEIHGKPATPAMARERWRAMRGREGWLHTGHWIVDVAGGPDSAGHGRTASTLVRFAELSDAEIDDYIATGEPLRVAGAFTVDGLGGPFVTGIEGDFHNVVGLSLPLLRLLLIESGSSLAEVRTPPLL